MASTRFHATLAGSTCGWICENRFAWVRPRQNRVRVSPARTCQGPSAMGTFLQTPGERMPVFARRLRPWRATAHKRSSMNVDPMTSIVDYLDQQAARIPDKPFLTQKGVTVTFAEMRDRVLQIAQNAEANGVSENGRVLLYIQDQLHYLMAYFAVMSLGATAVHMYPQRKLYAAVELYDLVDATGIISDKVHSTELPDPCTYLDMAALLKETDSPPAPTRKTSEVAYMMATSGTTGTPKAVMTTHENIVFVTRTIMEMASMTDSEKELIVMPLGSTGGLGHVHACLLSGSHGELIDYNYLGPKDPSIVDTVLSAFQDKQITGFLGWPWILEQFVLREDFSQKAETLKYLLVNVHPLTEELVEKLRAKLPGRRVGTYYGLTEASRSVYQLYGDKREHYTCAGKPSPGVEVELRQTDAATGIGEVCIRGKNVLMGYWGLETPATDEQGFFHTGDLGAFDGDGYLKILGRSKDTINVGGLKCLPGEVETWIVAETPEIAECAVVGVPDPGSYERVAVAVVVNGEVEQAALLSRVRETCRKHFDAYKVPRELKVLPALSRTALGKVDRKAIRAEIMASEDTALAAAEDG